VKRLVRLVNDPARPLQIIFAGKAHPADDPGKRVIQDLYRFVKESALSGRIVFLEDYDMDVGRHLVQGVDVWLNTPRRPMEASGTSGEKAGLNGVLNFSVLDGWWREGYNGKTAGLSAAMRITTIPKHRMPQTLKCCLIRWNSRSCRCTMISIRAAACPPAGHAW